MSSPATLMEALARELYNLDHQNLIAYVALLQSLPPDGPYGVRCYNVTRRTQGYHKRTRYPIRFRDSRKCRPDDDEEPFTINNYTHLDDTCHSLSTYLAKRLRPYGKVFIRDLVNVYPVMNIIKEYWERNKTAVIDFTQRPLQLVLHLDEVLACSTRYAALDRGVRWNVEQQELFTDNPTDI